VKCPTDLTAFCCRRRYLVRVGSRTYDALWGTTLRATTTAHKFVYRISRGKLGRRFPGGAQVVWITTLGRKSGQWRKTPLLAMCLDEGWGIAGSNAGQEKVPGWVFNIEAHNRGRIEVDGQESGAIFTRVNGELRDRIYQGLIHQWSGYDMYAKNIVREIPVYLVKIMDPV
jgi:deazaflavin-dependent oxidoreductase (nitroreductase family)